MLEGHVDLFENSGRVKCLITGKQMELDPDLLSAELRAAMANPEKRPESR
jgi:hypothetical protein